MKRFFVVYCVLVSFCLTATAQGEVDKQGTLFYRDEKSGAFMLNSNGFGLSGAYAKRVDAANKILFDIDFVYLRHPKEEKTSSPYSLNSSTFVFGKRYLPVVLRFGYGKQKEIFRKFDVGGISVRRYYLFGPSLAILKPIYYNVDYIYTSSDTFKTQKYNRNIFVNPGQIEPGANYAYIDSRASFFKGFGELKFYPGAFLKTGLSFEYSRFDQVIHAVEAGVIFEGFTDKLPIMDTKENYQFFITLFVSYRIGFVFDPNAPKKKRKKTIFCINIHKLLALLQFNDLVF